ncbi:AbrB family transcriptional regulator [Salipiger mangrovisoli]|uniref:AbrB family transcriptional regulator n=1 Tax=Salipiger mangrovisoli TaxID=2865933 RepID=A0ABR9X046_9RHOB|nr:AbrB family transcriptional regulator [Salipiger mangrovisoli]MBE9636917.1 AbrB family transcriptional regulator [Salipiger mangrovisoli]
MARPTPARLCAWLALIALSALLSAGLELLKFPAALLLGPMLAAIALAASGAAAGPRAISAPRPIFELAQAAVGAMIAGQIPASVLPEIARDWPIFLAGVVSVIIAAALLGYLLAMKQVLPGSTAVWGSSPGAAQAMVFLAEAHGADIRLVAVMQYLRVVMVAAGASLVAHLWVGAPELAPETTPWFPPPDRGLLDALLLMAIGIVVTRLTRMPAGTFLLPLLLGAVANGIGWLSPQTPQWLMALAYAAIGWAIGLRFSRDILRHTARALPRLALSVLLLMGVCGLMAAALVVFVGVDPLTAYLATSPGGADSVAVIAAASDVDMAFVMAMQTLRFIIVLATGPMIARFVAARVDRARPARQSGH